jgi:hypothetical protein
VDHAPANAKTKSQQPQNQEQSDNRPKHSFSPVPITKHRYSEIRQNQSGSFPGNYQFSPQGLLRPTGVLV